MIDSQNTDKGSDVIVAPDVNTKHPLVNALLGYGIQMILPRPLKAMNSQKPGADVKVEEVLFSSGAATLLGERTSKPARYCTAAVIEKGAVPGVATARGATRILVLGDSTMFVNTMIEKWSNRDFAGFAANWLLDRTQLLEGVSPRPVTEFRITMTQEQMRRCRWLLLGAVPGTVLAFGGLVWLRRRK